MWRWRRAEKYIRLHESRALLSTFYAWWGMSSPPSYASVTMHARALALFPPGVNFWILERSNEFSVGGGRASLLRALGEGRSNRFGSYTK